MSPVTLKVVNAFLADGNLPVSQPPQKADSFWFRVKKYEEYRDKLNRGHSWMASSIVILYDEMCKRYPLAWMYWFFNKYGYPSN